LKIPEVIPEGGEKEYKFREQQEAEAECWEKKQSEDRQQKLQDKYQRLKHKNEHQQKTPTTRMKTKEEETNTGGG